MRRKHRIAASAAAMVLALLIFTSNAAFDENNALHIQPEEIDNATLAIGTHLIYLGSLTDELYEIALASAEESGQSGEYYKSELGGGAWYEISAASSLDDIMEEGKQIDDGIIGNLFFTHHTRADGITYDLRTDQPVNVYDIHDPYNLSEMQELSQLKNQLQLLKQSGADASLIEEFYESELRNDATEEYDRQMSALNIHYLQRLSDGASKEELDHMRTVMGKVDAARRYEVSQMAVEKLNELMNQASSSTALARNSALMDAIGTALSEMESSGDTYAAERLEEGETAMSRIQYELTQELIDAVQGGDTEMANAAMDELDALLCIMEGRSVSPEKEIAFLENRLLPAAQQAYDETGSEAAKNELDFYNQWKDKLTGAQEDTGSKLSRLYDEKQKLQEEYLSALDKENLTEAKRLEALIGEKEGQIQAMESENPGETADGSASAAIGEMKDEALGLLEEASPDLELLRADVEGIGALCQTNPDLAGSALKELYEKMAAMDYLNETTQYEELMAAIEEALAENISLLDGTFSVEEVLAEVESVEGASFGGEAATGSASEDTPEDEAGTAAEDVVQDTTTTAVENAAALIGLAMFQEQTGARIGGLEELLVGKVQVSASMEHTLVYPKLAQDTGEGYVPADKLAEYSGFRYIWNDNKKMASLVRGKQFYEFRAFETAVRCEEDKTAELPAAAKFQTTVYLPGEYIKQEFGCEGYEISGTGYAVLADTSILETASEVCDALIRKGGG